MLLLRNVEIMIFFLSSPFDVSRCRTCCAEFTKGYQDVKESFECDKVTDLNLLHLLNFLTVIRIRKIVI